MSKRRYIKVIDEGRAVLVFADKVTSMSYKGDRVEIWTTEGEAPLTERFRDEEAARSFYHGAIDCVAGKSETNFVVAKV